MHNREHQLLTGLWRFSPDPHGDGEALGFWKPGWDVRRWREVPVPSVFEAGCQDLDFYEGVCWYRRSFCVDSAWHAPRLVLRFEAVNYRARVWLNGQWLGENRDGFLPFEFDVTGQVRRDGENVLAVAVDNAHHEGDVPGMHVGWRGYGGILRDVTLRPAANLAIEQLTVAAEPDVAGGVVTCRVRVHNHGQTSGQGAVTVCVYDATGETVLASLAPAAVAVSVGEVAEFAVGGRLDGAKAWSPATPVLYRAVATLRAGAEVADTATVRFGFRQVKATADGLRLNGEPLFLTGFNRHEDSPLTAMAADLATVRRDLEQMREAGANFVRLCHYPHDPAELDLCDELGLLVFCEIPLYFWNDAAEGRRTHAARIQTATRQLERLIARDANHPSVIFWSVSNETHEEHPEVAESNRALIRRARELDPTRLCVHVSNHWLTHPNFAEDDVICINHYPSIDWERRGHQAGADLSGAAENWGRELARLRQQYPAKPILVAEFGYCSFAGTVGNAFGEDEHARVIEAEFAAIERQAYVCGATIWCWADHAWPAGRFFNGLSVSPFGVLSRDRRKLQPFWTSRHLFRARQKLASSPAGGPTCGAGVVMIRPHLKALPVVPFPGGCGIRSMRVEDIGLWTDIQREAEPYFPISDTLFREQFGDDPSAIGWRCFLVTDPKGLGIGTISSWYNRDFHGQDYGRIHWVSLRPAWQGKGLGKAALAYAMARLAQWHERAYLVTSSERLAAIHLYLDFGFTPDLSEAEAPAVWREIATRLKHPALAGG